MCLLLVLVVGCGPSSRLVEQASLSAATLTPSTSGGVEVAYTLSAAGPSQPVARAAERSHRRTVRRRAAPGRRQLRPRLRWHRCPYQIDRASAASAGRRLSPGSGRPGRRSAAPSRASFDSRSVTPTRRRHRSRISSWRPGRHAQLRRHRRCRRRDLPPDQAGACLRLRDRRRRPAGLRRHPGACRSPASTARSGTAPTRSARCRTASTSFSVRATDLAGNTVVASVPVRLASSGRPDARILSMTFSPRRLMVGDELQSRRWSGTSGRCRCAPVGRRRATSTAVSRASAHRQPAVRRPGRRLATRRRLGRVTDRQRLQVPVPLGPRRGSGARRARLPSTGRIRVDHGPNLDRMVGPPTNRFFLYGGLIHEGIAFQDDRVGGAWIEVGY